MKDEILPLWLTIGLCLALFWSGFARTIFRSLS
jgi:hypothetical protein